MRIATAHGTKDSTMSNGAIYVTIHCDVKISLHVVVVLILLVLHQLITMPSKSTNNNIQRGNELPRLVVILKALR